MRYITRSIKISMIISLIFCSFTSKDFEDFIIRCTSLFFIVNSVIGNTIIYLISKEIESNSAVVNSSFVVNKYLSHFHYKKGFAVERSMILGVVIFFLIKNHTYSSDIPFLMGFSLSFSSFLFLYRTSKIIKKFK